MDLRELKALQDRRLYWVARNRSRRDPTKSAASFVVDLARQLESQQGDFAFALDAVSSQVDEDFRRHCRLGSVGNGVLVVLVNDAGMVAPVRLRWAGMLLRGLHQTREGTKIRRIHFEYGDGGAEFMPPDKQIL
jgi:hypothetical protein